MGNATRTLRVYEAQSKWIDKHVTIKLWVDTQRYYITASDTLFKQARCVLLDYWWRRSEKENEWCIRSQSNIVPQDIPYEGYIPAGIVAFLKQLRALYVVKSEMTNPQYNLNVVELIQEPPDPILACNWRLNDPVHSPFSRMSVSPRRVRETPAPPQLNDQGLESKEPSGPLSCRVCFNDVAVLYAFVPCGHRCVCRSCFSQLSKQSEFKCVICRQHVSQAIPVYDA